MYLQAVDVLLSVLVAWARVPRTPSQRRRGLPGPGP